MTRKLCLTIIAGPDGTDVDVPYIPLNETLHGKKICSKDLHIAWTDDFGGVPVSEDTRIAIEAVHRKVI